MKLLFVGQKVRIVGTEWKGAGPAPHGQEGVIIGKDGTSTTGHKYEWIVHVTGRPGTVVADSHELEPILPDGLESPEQIKKLFEPEPVRELIFVEKKR